MTKHFFQAVLPDQNLSVDCGWDRPCQHFYLNVERTDAPNDEEPIYISMYDARLFNRPGPFLGGLMLDELRERLEELCITPPTGLIDALNEDQRVNRGNAVTTWPAS